MVYFEGSLQTRSWEDRDGNTRYTTEVKAQEMQMLDSRGSSDGDYGSSGGGYNQQAQNANRGGGSRGKEPVASDDTFSADDDLPF